MPFENPHPIPPKNLLNDENEKKNTSQNLIVERRPTVKRQQTHRRMETRNNC
jgi:hypothetical protein